MQHVEIVLVVAAPNLSKRGNTSVLLLGNMLLAKTLPEDQTCLETAAELLLRYAGLTAKTGPESKGWIELVQAGIFEKKHAYLGRLVQICYGCLIPETTQPKMNATWSDILEVSKTKLYENHLEILRYVGLHL